MTHFISTSIVGKSYTVHTKILKTLAYYIHRLKNS